jgi:hypothetical protein
MLTFQKCVEECLDNTDFVKEFDRLMGSSLGPKKAASPMEFLVDQTTGYDEVKRNQDLKKFVAFVHETVWIRLPDAAKDPTQVVTLPPGGSLEELMREP